MKNLFNSINDEISLSRSKFENIESSSSSGIAEKSNIFTTEFLRLNDLILDKLKSFFKDNDLTDQQV